MPDSSPLLPPAPRQFGLVNWLGLQTLIGKEVGRFMKVHAQTISAPVITTLLFYLVFSIALGGENRMIEHIPYIAFLAPGLVMMAIAQNAFANTSSSLVIAKVQGNIVDVLMPPLSPLELTIGYTIGGIARGLLVGAVSLVVLALLIQLPFPHPQFVLFHAIMGSMMLALMGVIGGIWSDKFDQMAAVQNFIVMPATFLSGTFYASHQLPPFWQAVAHANPFFYMVDGFRYGLTGYTDGTLGIGLIVMSVLNVALLLIAYRLFATGYKLKS
jgi:ABC-2 type transport system permease protein